MKTRYISIFAALGLFMLTGCTDVSEDVYDKYTADDFYGSPEGSDVALASVYSQIAGNWGGVGYAGADLGWYDLNCMSSDEQVIPHRTTGDWGTEFARTYKHEWLPTDGMVNNTWNWLYKSVFTANLAVELLENANADQSKIAEAHVLRAFFYYLLMDDYGNVPFYTANTITVDQIPQASRQQVYDFVVSELTTYVDDLSPDKGGAYYGRFNKWAGYMFLAKVYLNAEVYTGTPRYQECLAACQVVTQGGYTLHSGAADASNPLGYKYFELFGDTNPEDETILSMFATVNVVSRNIYGVRTLYGPHANTLFGYSGWNGTIIPKDYFEKFDPADHRRNQFLVGDQGGGVNYTLDVPSLDNPGAPPMAGVRCLKFYPAGTMDGGGASNDFPIYRYADVLLMMAECNVRLGNAAAAKPFIDQVRERAGLSGLAGTPTLLDIYNERAFELHFEGHRRQDMIRFGTFLQPNLFRGASQEFKKLFPIPTSALDANHSLQQNPGY